MLVEAVPFSGTVGSDETRCFAFELQRTDRVLSTLTPNPNPNPNPNPSPQPLSPTPIPNP